MYASLAAGGAAEHIAGIWRLAVIAVIAVAVGQTIGTCSGTAARETDVRTARKRREHGIGLLPAGGRLLLVAVIAPVWGPRAALSGVLTWTIIAVAAAIAGRRPGGPASVEPVIACRDDGMLSRYLGRLVRGQLVPLPPAMAGLVATSMLAVLGLHNLPGIILLAPLAVMLLAAPGAGHPHDGAGDWLAAAVLQAGQYVYIAALGFASGVAPPVTFALCAMIAVRSADLASPTRHGNGMGWEGRMLAAGLGVILGIATFAYLALTAYLGVLVWWKVRESGLAIGKGVRP